MKRVIAREVEEEEEYEYSPIPSSTARPRSSPFRSPRHQVPPMTDIAFQFEMMQWLDAIERQRHHYYIDDVKPVPPQEKKSQRAVGDQSQHPIETDPVKKLLAQLSTTSA